MKIKYCISFRYCVAALIQYYPQVDLILINNYTSEKNARQMKDKYTIGMWKIKQLKTK